MSFLHGVETVIVNEGANPINLVKTSVVGLVGTAPKGDVNKLKVISSERNGVETFGDQVPGFTIPKALKSLFDQGASRVVVINVFDIPTMTTDVNDETLTIASGKATMAFAPINTPVVTNAAGTTTFVAGTDYKIDSFGNLVVLNFTAIAEGSTIKVTYKKLNAAAVTDAAVIGSLTAGVRTGFKLFEESYTTFGYIPKIIIAPTYCENTGVAAEMIVQADKLRAITIIDAPVGTLPSAAITARGPSGTLAGYKTSNSRVYLTYPYLKAYDPATDGDENRPYSAFLAGVMSANENYWESPSNKEIKGISGPERTITAALNDPNSEANQLNEAGIATIFSSFGTGFRTWGNRSAAFPSNTSMINFVSVQRVQDIVHESLELAMLPYIDRPINQALIDTIRQSCQSFINVLIGRGALRQGSKCLYNPEDNPTVEIAAGKLTFEIRFAGPTPAERITFKSYLDTALLGGLV